MVVMDMDQKMLAHKNVQIQPVIQNVTLWIVKVVRGTNVLINVQHAMIVMVMEYVLISVRLIKYVVLEHVIILKML
jgi:hypothetical protein